MDRERGKQEINAICMSLSHTYFSIVFTALLLSSNSVSARTVGEVAK